MLVPHLEKGVAKVRPKFRPHPYDGQRGLSKGHSQRVGFTDQPSSFICAPMVEVVIDEVDDNKGAFGH